MRPDEGNGGHGRRPAGPVAHAGGKRAVDEARRDDVVFDFAGLHQPDISDLALILTARLQSGAGERVWARALPHATWRVLHALGLAHLFHHYPSAGVPN